MMCVSGSICEWVHYIVSAQTNTFSLENGIFKNMFHTCYVAKDQFSRTNLEGP